MKNLQTLFVCSECDAEVALCVSPGAPAVHGKPENSCEVEAPELQTRECPECGHEFTEHETDCAIERAENNARDTQANMEEERAESRRDGWTWND